MKLLILPVLAIALCGAVAAPRSKEITITVNGQSVISRAPDVATVALGIVTINDVAQTATSENNRRYEDLRNRLHSIGISDPAIRTLSFNVNYVAPDPSLPINQRPRSGYTVTREIDVKLSNLDLVGQIIDQAVAANVTDINNVAYTLSNERQVYAQALGNAVADAQRQAKAMASAANLHIVRISGMQSGYASPPVLMRAGVTADAYRAAPTQIAPSNIDVQATVTITYVVGP